MNQYKIIDNTLLQANIARSYYLISDVAMF
jgi:hypothetical protein